MTLASRLYQNIFPYHHTFVFSCCPTPSANISPSCFSSILPICCSHFVGTCFVHHCCLVPQFFSDPSGRICWPLSRKPLSHFCVVIVSNSHMVDATPYLISSLSNYYYANLHVLLIKSILYILSSPMSFVFFLHHESARIKYFLSLAFCHVVFSLSISKIRDLGHTWYVCCHLVTLFACVTLPGKARWAPMGALAFFVVGCCCAMSKL
jgi:hypothetical protein